MHLRINEFLLRAITSIVSVVTAKQDVRKSIAIAKNLDLDVRPFAGVKLVVMIKFSFLKKLFKKFISLTLAKNTSLLLIIQKRIMPSKIRSSSKLIKKNLSNFIN